MDLAILTAIGQFVLWVVVGVIVGWIIGKLVDIILDRTVERALDKTGIGKKLREVGLDFSDAIGLFVGVVIFLLFLQVAVSYLPAVGGLWQLVINGIMYLTNVVIAVAFVTVGLLFTVLFVEYVEKFVAKYREDVATFFKMVLGIGLLWSVLYFALKLLNLQYTIFQDLLVGFVVMSVGVIIVDLVMSKVEKVEIKPILTYFLYGLFVLVTVDAIFSNWMATSTKIVTIFSYGFVGLFILAALPSVIKAIKEVL